MNDQTGAELSELGLPPREIWIDGPHFDRAIDSAGQNGRRLDHPTGSTITGTLQGSWPELGRVRNIPSSETDLTVTDINLRIGPQDEIHAHVR